MRSLVHGLEHSLALCRPCRARLAGLDLGRTGRAGPHTGANTQQRFFRRIRSAQDQHEARSQSATDRVYNELAQSQPQTTPPSSDLPKTEREETIQKARIVFGSRLAGPAERQREIDSASTLVAGIKVPPKPDEPENCCMSGCVNCVWDRYRDEMEEWAAASTKAREQLSNQRAKEREERIATRGVDAAVDTPDAAMPVHVASSMDDDGGGSDSNWAAPPSGQQSKDLFDDIPVGIREFMRTEKRLKEKKTKI